MSYKLFNISKPEKYTVYETNNATEKTRWHNVGTMIEFTDDNGAVTGRKISIPAIGLEAQIFPFKERDGKQPANDTTAKATTAEPSSTGIDYPEENIDINDIPF